MNDPEIITPITPLERKDARAITPFIRFIQWVRISCLIAGVLILGAAIWYFAGFADNDSGGVHLASAAGLSLGLGLMGFGPLFIIAYLARQVLRFGPNRKISVWTIVLCLPWAIVSVLFIRLGGLGLILGLPALCFSLVLLYWAMLVWRRAR